ncbi:Uncharacterised protein [Chryseobacterium nakagawai]|nr:Uncharacterised protein [Chryseobacterium nakagawai]
MRNNMTRITAKNDVGQFDNSTSYKDKTLNQLVFWEF